MRCPQRWAVVWTGWALLCTLPVPVRGAAQPAEAPGGPAPGTSPGVTAPEAPGPEVPPVVTATPDRRAGWRHEFSPAWHMATFFSAEDSHYTFHSLSLSYLMSVNASGPFVHLSFVIPLQARQDGRVHSISSVYQNSGGLDLLVGWQYRWAVGESLELESGPGMHMNALNLGGKPGLTNFNALQLGVGGTGIVRWRPGWQPGRVGWSIGVVTALALDLYDPLRSNDLKYGFVLRLGMMVGVDLP